MFAGCPRFASGAPGEPAFGSMGWEANLGLITLYARVPGQIHLEVFFAQNGTRGIARVHVDPHGFSFVGIGPA